MDEQVKVFVEITGCTPSIFQQELMVDRVKDVDRWRKAVIWWMSNDYRPQSVGKMLDYYDQMGTEQRYGKQSKPDVGRWDGVPVEPDPPCRFCGQLICFSLHEDEVRSEWAGQAVQ